MSCLGMIQGTFIACGEGSNFCSETCQLRAQLAAMEIRRDELLALVARISQETPLDSEVADALRQRGVMLAEIGTLRAERDQLKAEVESYRAFVRVALQ